MDKVIAINQFLPIKKDEMIYLPILSTPNIIYMSL